MAGGKTIEQITATKQIKVKVTGTIPSRHNLIITMEETVVGRHLDDAMHNLIDFIKKQWPDFILESAGAGFKYD